ncbi:hypothetical protein M501DRAFT_1014715 [Patellaria atrata CBS 101060]|uniref:Galactose oxidase n=1 Tax=Patellaria atrata CBS 101060 TaxID=1346257 RepID=A0A9P4VTA3_9PEZI|nr:hypothetical protein M501DRAFT_1014715 [Patellaria atrata CBS 101060]
MSYYFIKFILFSLTLLHLSRARDPLNDFCRRFGHQTAVIDRRLYIDGGKLNWKSLADNPLNFTNQAMLYNDLDVTNRGGMPQLYANLTKDGPVPDVSGGILWADEVNKMLYLYGGEHSDIPEDFTFWSYDTLYDRWDQREVLNSIQRVSYGAGVTVNERAEGYYLGGWLNNKTVPGWTGDPVATNTIIRYNLIEDTWSNFTGPDSTGRAEGVMVYLPASDGGLLIYFGGILDPFRNGTVVGSNMSEIYVYDLNSAKWYKQNASGEIPEMRRKFCAGVTWPEDQSSYNIYLYGGLGVPPDAIGFDDVYILSLPSFTWIKWWPTEPGEGAPHHSMSCNVISGAQMLIIGGTFPISNSCDSPDTWGTHNMNLGANGPAGATWDIFYPKIMKYTVPDVIVAEVGGDGSGGATLKGPAEWSHRDLPVYFSRIPSFSARSPTRTIPTSTASPTPTSRPDKTNIGAIAGGTIGGIISLILLLTLLWLCIKRRKTKQSKQHSSIPIELPATTRTPKLIMEPKSTTPTNHSTSPSTSPHINTPINYTSASLDAHNPQMYGDRQQYFHPSQPPPTRLQPPVPVPGPYPPRTQHHHPSPDSPPYAHQHRLSPETPQYHSFPPPSQQTHPPHQTLYPTPYDPANHTLHRQHFPPPPPPNTSLPRAQTARGGTVGSEGDWESVYSDETEQTTRRTPAHFYPRPLRIRQDEEGWREGRLRV